MKCDGNLVTHVPFTTDSLLMKDLRSVLHTRHFAWQPSGVPIVIGFTANGPAANSKSDVMVDAIPAIQAGDSPVWKQVAVGLGQHALVL